MTPDEVNVILRGGGARGVDQFSSPEAAAAAAQRVQTARAAPAPNLSAGMPAGIGSKGMRQFIDGAAPVRRAVPDDVTIIAAPEGAIRSDDRGAIAAVDRKRAADAGVMDAALARATDDPLVAHILDSDMSQQAKIATVMERIAQVRDTNARGGTPDLPDVPPVDPYTAPTSDVARAPGAQGFMNRVRGRESGGNDAARSPTSSATGRYQFTDATWLQQYKARFGSDLPDAQILAKRGNGQLQDTLMRDLTDGNAKALRQAGFADDDGNLYLSHFLGRGGALRALRADPETPIVNLVGRNVVEANRSILAGKTVGDVVGWAHERMGGRTPEAPAPWRMSAPDGGSINGAYSGRSRPNAGRSNAGDTSLGDFEDQAAAASPTNRQMEQGAAGAGPSGASGGSDRLFRSRPEDAPFEARAAAQAAELRAKAQADLGADWVRRAQQQQEAAASGGFARQAAAGERATRGDPAGLYRGKYDQRPHRATDASPWAMTKEGFVAGKAGSPVAFRTAREAATWAAANKMGGDFELHSWGGDKNTTRVVLRRRDGSTYGEPVAPASFEPAAGRSANQTQRMLPEPRAQDSAPVARTPDPRPEAPQASVGAGSREVPVGDAQASAASRPVRPERTAADVGEARRVARSALVGRTIRNESTGVEATLSGNNLAKMTSDSALRKSSSPKDHLLAVVNADHLFRGATLIERGPDKKGHPTLSISRWRSILATPEGDRSVRLTVKEEANPSQPNPLYTIETAEVEPGRYAPPEGGIERVSGVQRTPQPGSAADVGAIRPKVEPAAETRAPVLGGREQVITARGRPIDTQFEVREARDLVSSGDPAFDQRLQPRDRSSRSSSDAQIAEIASRLDPEQLHTSRQAAQGAPIVGADRRVESGNGRVAAIRRAYELHPEKAQSYREMIAQRGLSTDGFEQPVLVRRRLTDMADDDRVSFVREANERDTMGMSSTEQAKIDAGTMSTDTVRLYRGGGVGDAGNRDFARRWIDEVASPAERNTLMQPDGTLSADGVRRMRSSLLAKAFDDADLVAKVVEDPDTEIRAIGNTLTDAAPAFAKLRDRIKAGDLPADYDITRQVAEAANMIARARNEGKRVGDLVRQDDMFGGRTDPVTEAVARLMFRDDAMTKPRSAADMADALRFYTSEAEKHGHADMFGGDASAARATDILEAARRRTDARSDHQRLFSAAPEGWASADTRPVARAGREGFGELLARTATRLRSAGNAKLAALAEDVGGIVRELEVKYGPIDDAEVAGSGRDASKVGGFVSQDLDGSVRARLADADKAIVAVHEGLHAAVALRYGRLRDAMARGDAPGAVRALDRLYRRAKVAFDGKGDADGLVRNALDNLDEFFAYGLTQPSVQSWLKGQRGGGLWGQFVDTVRRLVGLDPRQASMLDEVIEQGGRIVRDMRQMPTDDRQAGANGQDFAMKPGETVEPTERGWDRVVDLDGLRGDVAGIKRAIGDPLAALRRFTEPMKRVVAAGVFTNDARLRGLASRFNSGAIRELADHFQAEAGKGSSTGRTYHEAVQRASVTRTQQAFDALEPHLANKAAMGRIRDLLATPNKAVRATEAERGAARTVRDLLKETLAYRRAAGETIGEVSDGYFPRLLDVQKVAGQREAFLAAATRVYRSTGMATKEAEGAAKAWFEHAFDTYAGLDGGLGFSRASADGVGSKTAKAREFGKIADEQLRDFYQGDVMDVLAGYFGGAARRAEHARRFGVKGAEGSIERASWEKEHGAGATQLDVLERRIKRDVLNSGLDPQGVLQQIESVMRSNLGQMGTRDQFTRTAVSYLHTWNQLAKMDRVTVSSLGDLTMGFIRGGPRYGFSFFKDAIGETVRQIRKAPASDAARWAEAFGVANDAFVNQILTARAGIEGGTAGSQKVLTNFYKAVGLHQFTEGGRIAAAKMAQRMVHDFAHDLESSSARVRSRAELYLRELGVQEPKTFGAQLRSGAPTREQVLGDKGFASEYGTAVYRAVQQTILMPNRAEKPTWSAHPVGSMLFSLMSYSYGFKKNVLDRSARLAGQGIKDRDMALLIPAFSLSIMAAFQALNDTYLRPALFGSSYDFANESPLDALTRIADRSGFLGAASPLVNAVKAVKYDRSLLESLSGPVIGSVFNAAQKGIVEPLSDRNSPNTDTAERNAAAAFYDAVVDPVIDGIAAARLKGVLRTAAILGTGNKGGGVLPADKDAFVDTFGGEEPEPDDAE